MVCDGAAVRRWLRLLMAVAALVGAAACTDEVGSDGGPCNAQGQCLPGLYCIEGRCQTREFARVHYCLGKQCGLVSGFECGVCAEPRVCRSHACEYPSAPDDAGTAADAISRDAVADAGLPDAARDAGITDAMWPDAGTPRSFVTIEPGSFQMGSPSEEPRHSDAELQHHVRIGAAYLLQSTEVTQAQWFDVMRFHPSRFGACGVTSQKVVATA